MLTLRNSRNFWMMESLHKKFGCAWGFGESRDLFSDVTRSRLVTHRLEGPAKADWARQVCVRLVVRRTFARGKHFWPANSALHHSGPFSPELHPPPSHHVRIEMPTSHTDGWEEKSHRVAVSNFGEYFTSVGLRRREKFVFTKYYFVTTSY